MASVKRDQHPSIHMSIMSRLSERNQAECHSHDAVGYVPTGEPGPRQDRAREGGYEKAIQIR